MDIRENGWARTMPLSLEVVRHDALNETLRNDIIVLCNAAFDEPMEEFIRLHTGGAHVLGWLDDALVSHASWVPRWLQPAGLPVLRTAYIEDVGTHPDYQGRGFGTAVMRRMAEEIRDFELAALSTGYVNFYGRSGWEAWRGPGAIRTRHGLVHTPDHDLMILRLPRTPPLDLDALITAEWRDGELW